MSDKSVGRFSTREEENTNRLGYQSVPMFKAPIPQCIPFVTRANIFDRTNKRLFSIRNLNRDFTPYKRNQAFGLRD